MRTLIAVMGFIVGLGNAAMAQTMPKNPMIDIEYVPPQNSAYTAYYEKLKELQVLETFQQFLAPLKLPRKITVRMQQCGAKRLVYKPGGAAVICYEYVDMVNRLAPDFDAIAMGPPSDDGQQRYMLRGSAIAGAVTSEMLNEVAHAAFDVLQIPVWGNADDAADNVASIIMLQFGDLLSWRILTGTAWVLAQESLHGTADFSSSWVSADTARFYNYLCVAVVGNYASFSFLTSDIPQSRLDWCVQDYFKLNRSFKQAIMPYIDQTLLKQSQSDALRALWEEKLSTPKN